MAFCKESVSQTEECRREHRETAETYLIRTHPVHFHAFNDFVSVCARSVWIYFCVSTLQERWIGAGRWHALLMPKKLTLVLLDRTGLCFPQNIKADEIGVYGGRRKKNGKYVGVVRNRWMGNEEGAIKILKRYMI